MRILLLGRYDCLGASSRIRAYQYLPYLKRCGIEITVSPLLLNDYLKLLYEKKNISIVSIFNAYLRRLRVLLRARKFDLIWIEKEIFPWLPAFIEKVFTLGTPYLVDYDDAIFHNYDIHPRRIVSRLMGRKIDEIMANAAVVTAGNEYLASRARQAGAKTVVVLPSVIDLAKYPGIIDKTEERSFTIGWIGSPSTARHLLGAETALKQVCKNRGGKVVLVGAGENPFSGLIATIRDWDEASETDEIGNFDVGIMPLPDNPWERGKCGFKLIQYMACGKPVVASPVGVNREIVVDGVNGFLASSQEEWVRALERLKSDPELRKTLGANGRRMVEEKYCLQVTAPRLHRLLLEAAGRT
jgi:glycosyltransferase involved in cell wall biosynthesis